MYIPAYIFNKDAIDRLGLIRIDRFGSPKNSDLKNHHFLISEMTQILSLIGRKGYTLFLKTFWKQPFDIKN